MRCIIHSISLILILLIFPDLLIGQEPMHLQRIDEPIILDGVLDEPVWQTIDPLEMTMQVPNYGADSYRPIEIRVAYDNNFIYLSAFCKTPQEELTLTSYRRNHMAPNNDYVAIMLDTFNDNENALTFSVMPTGARLDYTVSNDAQGSNPMNISWNTFWDAETALFEDGWSVEIRIPFTSLRFQDDDGRVEMGMIVYRWYAANASVSTFPAIPPNYGFWSFNKPSKAQKIVMNGVYSNRTAYFTPYTLGGLDQNFLLNTSETAFERHDHFTNDFGLDFKYGLTNNLTLDVTLNTDFAQVEADDQQVNLTRFPLFFPEQRLFFQERASIFNFGTLERSSLFDFTTIPTNQLFHSRQIGLSDGQPVPLYGGIRLVGRTGGLDIGILNMQTQSISGFLPDGSALPSENFGVIRLRRQVLNPYSNVGVMATSRFDRHGRYNITYGLDGNFRFGDDDHLTISWAQTAESEYEYRFSDTDNSHIHARWEKRSLDGFGYDLNLSRSGEIYNPEVGFNLRNNYTRIGDRIFYGWFPGENSRLQQHQVYLNSAVYFDNIDGRMETFEFGPSWQATLNSNNTINIKLFHFIENLNQEFFISNNAEIGPGDYNYTRLGARYEILSGDIRGSASINAGTFFDGWSGSVSFNTFWILSRHLQINGFYNYNRIRFPDRDQGFDGHLARMRFDVALNREISTAAFIQFNNASNGIFTNFRFRYNPREGNDFYIVYNEGFNTNRNREFIPLPRTQNRTILLKYSHTLVY